MCKTLRRNLIYLVQLSRGKVILTCVIICGWVVSCLHTALAVMLLSAALTSPVERVLLCDLHFGSSGSAHVWQLFFKVLLARGSAGFAK